MYPLPNSIHLHFDKAIDQLDDIERRVLAKAHERKIISTDVNAAFTASASSGERLADGIAPIGGSWSFIVGFLLFLTIWCIANTVLLTTRAFDPYPFIFLNLVLSMLAAIQAPIIMMSQNSQAARPIRGDKGLRGQPQGRARSPVAAPEDRSEGIGGGCPVARRRGATDRACETEGLAR